MLKFHCFSGISRRMLVLVGLLPLVCFTPIGQFEYLAGEETAENFCQFLGLRHVRSVCERQLRRIICVAACLFLQNFAVRGSLDFESQVNNPLLNWWTSTKKYLSLTIDSKMSGKEPEIYYSTKYTDEEFEYRHVILPKELAKQVPKHRLMSESEWRKLGVRQSPGWIHYLWHEPEPHILLFKRPLSATII